LHSPAQMFALTRGTVFCRRCVGTDGTTVCAQQEVVGGGDDPAHRPQRQSATDGVQARFRRQRSSKLLLDGESRRSVRKHSRAGCLAQGSWRRSSTDRAGGTGDQNRAPSQTEGRSRSGSGGLGSRSERSSSRTGRRSVHGLFARGDSGQGGIKSTASPSTELQRNSRACQWREGWQQYWRMPVSDHQRRQIHGLEWTGRRCWQLPPAERGVHLPPPHELEARVVAQLREQQ